MIVYPNAKINLGLNIIEKRPDGFHNIESCFLPIDLCDILEVVESDTNTYFSSTGIPIPGNSDTNLCVMAWQRLKENYTIPNVSIRLHKQIPIGAGLGGGSADGAFMLKALNELFDLKLSIDVLEKYAAQLGSDCAFFIKNKPALAQGRGDLLSEIPLNLKDHKIVLINPGIHIGTAEAYSGITPQKPVQKITEILNRSMNTWQSDLKNDFEDHIFSNHPEIVRIKAELKNIGAIYTAMSGSGSTVFGIFKQKSIAELPKEFDGYFTWEGDIQ